MGVDSMNKFNIGDKIMMKENFIRYKGEIGEIIGVECESLNKYLYKVKIGESTGFWSECNLKLYEKKFKCDNLKSGMKVKLRNGQFKFVLRDSLIGESDVIIKNKKTYQIYLLLESYTDSLINKFDDSWDIMIVYDEEDNILWSRNESINWGIIEFGTDIMVWQGDELPIKAKFLRYDKGEQYPFVVWSYEKNDIDYYVNGKLMESDE